MSGDDLAYLGAEAALRQFRARTLSPVELMTAVIARAERLNPRINAFTYTCFDQAIDAARKAETARNPRALEGIPIVIKDAHAWKGEITTNGSKVFADFRPDSTHPCVERLLEAGAIPIARSTTPEFGIALTCSTPLWGTTRNPWNLDYSPSGSSSGAAAALAAGMTTLADGSDYGGSVRIPAGYCGLFGYKPAHGRLPASPPSNLDSFGAFGALARSVRDGALMIDVMAGPHPRDITSLRPKLAIPSRFDPIRGWRIAVSLDLGFFEVDEVVRRNTLTALDGLREAGATVDEVKIDWTLDALLAFEIHASAAFAHGTLPHIEGRLDEVTPLVRRRAALAPTITGEEFYWAEEVRARMYEPLGALFERYDLFVCPTTAIAEIPAEHHPIMDRALERRGRTVAYQQQATLTYPFNLLGQLPVATVPSGFTARGIPTGIQLVGRPFDDLAVFQAAAAYEQVRPWFDGAANRPPL